MNIWEKQYKDKGFGSQREYPNESLIAFTKENLNKGDKILELGCGSGANIWFLAKEGLDAYGVDFSETGVDYCNKMLEKWNVKGKIKVGDIRELDFSDNFFDAVADVVSTQHLTFSDHLICFKEVFRCLKDGGKFFSFHLGENSVSYIHGGGKLIDINTIKNINDSNKPLANNGPTCFLSRNDAFNLLSNAGFKGIVIDKVTRTYNNQEFQIEYLVIKANK